MIKHIFVVGASRSGTTMMGRILSAHPQVHNFRETHFFEELWDPQSDSQPLQVDAATQLAARLLAIERFGYYAEVSPDLVRDQAEKIVRQAGNSLTPAGLYDAVLATIAHSQDKTIACEQTPRNIYYLSTILELWPTARVVVMVRDPRDVMLSQKKKWQRGLLGAANIPRKQLLRFWANYHPITMALLWNGAIKAASPFREHPRVYFQSFETLLANSEKEISQLCCFLDIEFNAAMLSVPQVGSSHSPDRRGLGVDATAAGRWLNEPGEATDIYICERITRNHQLECGYPASGWYPNVLKLLVTILSLPPKTVLAFALNMKRVRNLPVSLARRLGINPGKLDGAPAKVNTPGCSQSDSPEAER